MLVAYLGGYDPEYDRNAVIRRGLAMHGVRVAECRIERVPGWRAMCLRLLQACRRDAGLRPDVALLAEFDLLLAPAARWQAWRWRAPLVFDPLISHYDTEVHDRGILAPFSRKALRLWVFEWIAFRTAQLLLADTEEHKRYYMRAFGVPGGRIRVVPVGARTDVFYPRRPRPHSSGAGAGGLEVLFWGSYIPLQGVQWIIRAAHLLRGETGIRWTLIGNGQTYEAVRREAAGLGLEGVNFIDRRVSRGELAEAAARADITLGIFGDTPKAGRVVPNKVYQGLAMARPLITADTPALREFFTHGEHLHMVPAADPGALADAVMELAGSARYRGRLAEGGHEHFTANFTPERIGGRVKAILEEIL